MPSRAQAPAPQVSPSGGRDLEEPGDLTAHESISIGGHEWSTKKPKQRSSLMSAPLSVPATLVTPDRASIDDIQVANRSQRGLAEDI